MRPLWKDEAGWFIAIAVVLALLVIAGLHGQSRPAPSHGKPVLLPTDVGHWPTGG